MATPAGVHSNEALATSSTRPLIRRTSFEYAFLPATLWLIAGSYADAWAHGHIARLETFFTPWHAILYSGYLVTAGVMLGTVLLNRLRGATWAAAIPQGYELSLLGVIGFFFGGIGDLTWHTLFGIEQNINALFSPTHLFLMICFGLIVIGPYRARYRRKEQPATLAEHLLLALACSWFLVTLSNFTQVTSPFLIFWPQVAPSGQILAQAGQPGVFWPQSLSNVQDILQLQAVEGYLLQVVLFTGFALYTIRRFRLTFGFFTFVQTFVAFSLSFLGNHPVVILIGLLAGLLIDGAYAFIRPSMTHPTRFRLFAAASAAALYVVYMLSLQLMGGITWSIHMAAGSVFVTAMVGWLLSYLVLPAQTPEPAELPE